MNKEIYMTTLRCNTNRETHRKVVEYIENRNRERYRSVNDYLIAAVLNFEDSKQYQNADKADMVIISEIIRAVLKEELSSLIDFKESKRVMDGLENIRDMAGDETKNVSENDNNLPPSVNNFLESLGV